MGWTLTQYNDALDVAGAVTTITLTDTAGLNKNCTYYLKATGNDAVPDNIDIKVDELPGGVTKDSDNFNVGGNKNLTWANVIINFACAASAGVIAGIVDEWKLSYEETSGSSGDRYTEASGVFLTSAESISAGNNPEYGVSTYKVAPGVYNFIYEAGSKFYIYNECSEGELTMAESGSINILLENNKVVVTGDVYVQPVPDSFEQILRMASFRTAQDGNINSSRFNYAGALVKFFRD